MDVWVLVTTLTDANDGDDTGVLGVFGSRETALRGAEALVPCLWSDDCSTEYGDVDEWHIRFYIEVPGFGEVVWRLERHRIDEYAVRAAPP